MYGTVARYVQTLCEWNPGLSERGALQVVRALFGIELPGIATLSDFDRGFPQEFFDQIVVRETERALARSATRSGSAPGWTPGVSPTTASPSPRMTSTASSRPPRAPACGASSTTTTGTSPPASGRSSPPAAGSPWQSTTSPRPLHDPEEARAEMPGYYPPDLPIL